MTQAIRQPDEALWDVADVARYLKCSVGAVRHRVLHRTIPFQKVGRFVRFRRSAIDAWIAEQNNGAATAQEPAA